MGADVSELRKLGIDLAAMHAKAEPQIKALVAEVAGGFVQTARSHVAVDTGDLRDSITAKIDGVNAEITVGARQGFYVEFGTSRMPPRPFMRPAGNKAAAEMAAGVDRIIEGLIA